MTMRCECGGEFGVTRLATYDFTPIAGLPSQLANIRGLRCARCGDTTLEGRVINAAMNLLTVEVTRVPARLSPEHSRFLRRRLGLSQQALAGRMGVHRVTVADWETGRAEISPQHDHILRSMVLAHCAQRSRRGVDPAVMAAALRGVHHDPAQRDAGPIVIEHHRGRAVTARAAAW
jgi:DNA-binding transcriptional regulator YiaG